MKHSPFFHYGSFALLCIISLLSLSVKAENVITIEQAGTLSTLLSSDAQDATIIGPINGTDVKYLRQLIQYNSLTSLNLKETRFVAGGDAYLEDYKTTDNIMTQYMFHELSNLKSVELPLTVSTIQRKVLTFTGITEIIIPDNIRTLDWDDFASCPNLKTAVVGKNIQHMGQGIFWNSPLKDVYVKPMTPPSLAAYMFTSNPIIHVYSDVLSDYQASDWAQYGTIVGDLENYYPHKKGSEEMINQQIPNFFNDYSCTSLKPEYQNMDDNTLAAKMIDAGMSEFMVDIAKKLKNEDWASYEKEFRIHDYKAYSDANYWNNKLKSTGGSFMGNPTGIYANETGQVYVFVDTDVPTDASLYISGCIGNDLIRDAKSGVKLTKGLNVVDVSKDKMLYIIYTADTKSMDKKLNEWPAIKIHIEGGAVNGYYDVSRHSDADYKAILKNATHERFTVKGSYSAFNFKTESYRQIWPESIIRSINWFDSITVWEKEVMGICESVANGYKAESPFNLIGGEGFFPSYYNNPNWAIQGEVGDAGWANSSSYRTSYNGFDCVKSSFEITDSHDGWCAAHETGHNNQGAINLEGCTEVSNNLFSNIMQFLGGAKMTSGYPLSTTINDYTNHTPFVNRDIWSMTRMYYQLYLYYHQARKNTAFYPTLFTELRKDPLELWSDTNKSLLKFVRKVCEITNEDLTDFFRAWGFFEPCDGKIDDYGIRGVIVRQSDIDATLAEISKYPRKNREILFIEDRIEFLKTTDFLTTPGKNRRNSDEKVGTCGELGQFTEYLSVAPSVSEYTYLQSDSIFVMTGNGGVGFIVLDENDQLVYASNNKKFCIPSYILAESYTIYSIDADGTLHQAKLSEKAAVQEVNVRTAGTLSSLLSSAVIKAKISGSLNGTDIKYLRKSLNNGNLSVLDLSEAKIVSGGTAYYDNYKTTDNQIGDYMFFECNNLVSVKLPKTITYIGQKTFTRTGIKEVDIPDSVERLEWDAFASCPGLTSATVGDKVSRMGQGIFYGSAIKNVYVKPMTPPSLSAYMFTSNPTIHVYSSALSAYKASAWAQYGTIVGDLDEIIANDIQQIGQDQQDDESIYNLFGQKVKNNAQDAILIKGGKKILVH